MIAAMRAASKPRRFSPSALMPRGSAGLPDSAAGLECHDLHEHGGRHLRTALRLGDGGLLYDRHIDDRKGGLLRLRQRHLAVRERQRMADVVLDY